MFSILLVPYSFIVSSSPFRAFEDLQVFWRATFDKATPTLVNIGVNLARQLVQTSGTVLCRRGEIICTFTVEVQDDEVREGQRPPVKLATLKSTFCQAFYNKIIKISS